MMSGMYSMETPLLHRHFLPAPAAKLPSTAQMAATQQPPVAASHQPPVATAQQPPVSATTPATTVKAGPLLSGSKTSKAMRLIGPCSGRFRRPHKESYTTLEKVTPGGQLVEQLQGSDNSSQECGHLGHIHGCEVSGHSEGCELTGHPQVPSGHPQALTGHPQAPSEHSQGCTGAMVEAVAPPIPPARGVSGTVSLHTVLPAPRARPRVVRELWTPPLRDPASPHKTRPDPFDAMDCDAVAPLCGRMVQSCSGELTAEDVGRHSLEGCEDVRRHSLPLQVTPQVLTSHVPTAQVLTPHAAPASGPKTSKADLVTQRVERARDQLWECGWYYGAASMVDAGRLLKDAALGTFLVRDSHNADFLFTLSVMTARGPSSVRIAFSREDGLFRLDSNANYSGDMAGSDGLPPGFGNVISLVQYYVAQTKKDGQPRARPHSHHAHQRAPPDEPPASPSRNHSPSHQRTTHQNSGDRCSSHHNPNHNRQSQQYVAPALRWALMDNQGKSTPIALVQPLRKGASSLQHLARLAFHRQPDRDKELLRERLGDVLPPAMARYLDKYPFIM